MQNFNSNRLSKKLLMSLLLSSSLLFACSTTPQVKTPEQIKESVAKEIPGLGKIDAVNKSPVAGMYEVVSGRRVFYASTDGKYLFIGNIVDPVAKKSLTEERVQELSKIDWNKLPLDLAIVSINGNGKRKLAVFTDPDCPYCQLFEKQVAPQLADTTIYRFLFPLPNHKDARRHSEEIWCSTSRATTLTAWMSDGKPLPNNTSCDISALDKVYKFGTEVVQLEATPTLVLENGHLLSGALPAEQLIAAMDKAKSK